jgi:DNA-binding response OmpR family regulator
MTNRRWRYVPIIAVTRLDNPQVRADLLNAGADAIAARTRRQYQNLMREGS